MPRKNPIRCLDVDTLTALLVLHAPTRADAERELDRLRPVAASPLYALGGLVEYDAPAWLAPHLAATS